MSGAAKGTLFVRHKCSPPKRIAVDPTDPFDAVWLCTCGIRWSYYSFSGKPDEPIRPLWQVEVR